MPTTISGTTGVSQIQDETVTSAKIVNNSINSQDLNGGNGAVALTVYTAQTTPLPALNTSFSLPHSLGVVPAEATLEFVCLTAEFGYSIGDVAQGACWASNTYVTFTAVWKSPTLVGSGSGSGAITGWYVVSKTTGGLSLATPANWAYRFRLRTA